MGNKLKFAVEDIQLLQDESIDTSQFSLLKVDAFATGKSLHDTYVTEETLRKTAKTILQKPFVFAIDERFQDLGTHDPKEIAGGFVPHNSRLDFKQLPDGRLMLSVDVLLWRRYCDRLIEYFQRDGGRKGVSVEIEVLESRQDPSNGLLEIVNYVYSAITGLGDMIQSAIPNAEAIMAFSKEFENARNNFENFSKYEEVDFTIPKAIRNNAKKALESKKGSPVALATARFLVNNEKVTPERLRQIHKFLNRKAEIDDFTINLYGGKQAKKWSSDIISQMDSIDEKKLAYYADEENKESNGNTELTESSDKMGLDKPEENEKEAIKVATEKDEKEKELDMAKPEDQEKPEDEKAETPEEQKKEEEKGEEKKFSYAEIFGTEEQFAKLFAEEEDDDEDTKAKFAQAKEEFGVGANPSVMMSAMFCKMCKMSAKLEKMSEDSKVYMAENEDLKKRFAEIEKEKKEFAVASTLRQLSEAVTIPEDKLEEMKAESEKYSFAELDGWKNYAKALCFDFKPKAKKGKDEEEDIIRYGLPFGNVKIEDSDDIWASLNK